MFRRNFIKSFGAAAAAGMLPLHTFSESGMMKKNPASKVPISDREYLWKLLSQVATPVFENMFRESYIGKCKSLKDVCTKSTNFFNLKLEHIFLIKQLFV